MEEEKVKEAKAEDKTEETKDEENNNNEKPKFPFKKILLYLLILILVITAASLITWNFAIKYTLSTIQKVLLTTHQNVKEYVFSEFGKTNFDKKLVVLTQDVNVEVYKDKDNRVLYDWLSVGSANMKIKFIDNKVQYYVPLDELKESDIIFEVETRTVKIVPPSVKIDKDVVVVQSDPDKIIKEENGSWSPFGPKIKDLNKDIMKEIKQQTLIAGYKPWIREKAQAEAKKALEALFHKILDEFLRQENLKLDIIMP